MVLASLFSVSLITLDFTIKDLDHELKALIQYLDYFLCFIFFSDFVLSFYLANNKKEFLKLGWLDLISSIPQVDALRYIRLFRVARFLQIFRVIKTSKHFYELSKAARLKGALATSLFIVLFSMSIASILILSFENESGTSNIKTAQEAIWWSFATVTTVGYGDFYPVTTEGRIVATLLMMVGIGSFASLAGLISAYFTDNTQNNSELIELRNEIKELKALITDRSNKDAA